MLAMDTQPHTPHQHSLLKRSTSIWRRFSKRERPAPPVPVPISAPIPIPSNEPRAPHKLQRRATTTSRPDPKKNIVHTHMQRIDIDVNVPKKYVQRIDLDVELPKKRAETTVPSTTRVLKSDMQTTPFPSHSTRVQTVAWNVFLTPAQVFSLVTGFRPEQMEDKWFIYSEGPDGSGKLKVHFHRSWTGLKMAELFVLIDLKGLGAGKIVGIKWNGSDQTNGMSEEEAKYMISTTCAWTLGVNFEKGF